MKDLLAIAVFVGALFFYEATPASQPQQSWEADTTYQLRKQREATKERNAEREQNRRIERLERNKRNNRQTFKGWCTGEC